MSEPAVKPDQPTNCSDSLGDAFALPQAGWAQDRNEEVADQLIGNRYRLLTKIGSGGMGVVWRAYDVQLYRMVALKRAKAHDSASGQKLLREARLAAGLQHPNVVTIYDAIVEGGEPWLVMELVSDFSLAEMLAHGPLPVRTVIEIGLQLADALEAVHERGIVHRDVKPGNVLVTPRGRVKLADFGISQLLVSRSHGGIGTLGYLAPEVLDGREPTTAADIFSLGVTLDAAVEGSAPCAPRRAAELGPVLAMLMRTESRERPTAAGARRLLTACLFTSFASHDRRRSVRR